MVAKERNVLAALAQRRNFQLDHIQSEVKIVAEFTFQYGFFQLFVGCGEDTHIHLDGLFAAEAAEFCVLQHV